MAFVDDPDNLIPEPVFVLLFLASSGPGNGLAGESRQEAIHRSTPRSSVEAAEIAPDRSFIQGSVAHARDQYRDVVCFPLDVTYCASSGNNQPQSEVESADTGAEGQGSEGR